MASLIPNEFFKQVAETYFTGAIWAALLMTNTTADTETDSIANIGDYSTLDECDDASYARVELANLAVNKDDANDRAEFDADDVTFSGLAGDSSRAAQGIYIYKDADDDGDPADDAANDVGPFIQFASNQTLNAGAFTVNFNAEGILQFASA